MKSYLELVLNIKLKWIKMKGLLKKTTLLFASRSWNNNNRTYESDTYSSPQNNKNEEAKKQATVRPLTDTKQLEKGGKEKKVTLNWNLH